jgi:ATP-dependent exoDNAse (exonuclease V) alpha subunit
MAELSIMDLPLYLSSPNMKGGANGVRMLGVLLGEVIPPEPFATMGLATKTECFAVVDLVGIAAKSGPYYAKGKMLTVIPRSLLETAKSKPSGRIAVELSGTSVKLSNVKDGVQNFITMMKWTKGDFNSWQFRAVDAVAFTKKDYPEFFDVVLNAYNNNWEFTYPCSIPDTYTDSCKDHVFNFLDTAIAKMNASPEANMEGWGNLGVAPVIPTINPDLGLRATITPVTPVTPASSLTGIGAGTSLGGSTKSNISDLVSNRASTNADLTAKRKFKVENRDKLAPRTKNADLMEDAIKGSDEKVAAIVELLKKHELSSASYKTDLEYCADALKRFWQNKNGAHTGRALFKEALERVLPDFNTVGITGETVISDNLNILGPSLIDNWLEVSKDQADNKFVSAMYEQRMQIYLQIIELLLGIRDKLVPAYEVTAQEGIDILDLMKTNPYNLCFVEPRITVEDLDKLAMMYGIDLEDAEVKRVRNVAYLHNFMLDGSNRVIGDNTVVKYNDLVRSVKSGYTFTKQAVETLKIEGYILKQEKLVSVKAFINEEVNFTHFSLPTNGWKAAGFKMVLENKDGSVKMVNDFIDSGLGVHMKLNGSDWVSDFVFAKKEMFIYNRLRKLCEYKPRKIDKAKVAKAIEQFEKMRHDELGLPPEVEYKLEARQAEAVYLIGNRVACLTGPAGSGKTTTAEAMVYGIENVLNVDPEAIMFCAPTGKAANRLKEVVRRNTRTINSLFGIGGDGVSLKDPENIRKKDDIKALIVDETSMPNINLMYELVLRIEDGTYVFFLGDKEQLPPIGFGKPFATMLTFLPTVVLNVTKRASDKSGITRNAKKIIYESDGVIEDLDDYPDFRIINDKDQAKVVDMIHRIVKYHLGQGDGGGFRPVENLGQDLKPDDIQIISPLNKYDWGTVNLNNVLHDTFNPKQAFEQSVFYSRGKDDNIEFRLRDRVMHVKSNQSERTRLVHHGQGSFTQLKNADGKPILGIANGDVGKVIGFFGAKDIDFERTDKEEELKALEQEFRGTENVMFLAVEFSDVDMDTLEPMKFMVLYRMDILQKNAKDIVVTSLDLKYLDLAYALTVHKLQGSQAKLCICIFLPVGGDFISRNMIYTSPTRAQESAYMIGDILGKDSCVNKGRMIEQTERRYCNIDNI